MTRLYDKLSPADIESIGGNHFPELTFCAKEAMYV